MKAPYTPEEEKISDLLVEIVNTFHGMDQTHPCHYNDFVNGIHKCQDVIIHRLAQRQWPESYPIK